MSAPEALRALFPTGVAIAVSAIIHDVDALLPPERELVAGSGRKRQREFATGRVLARRLLAELGYADAALLRAASGAPLWPATVVGAISHSDSLCVAVVGPASRLAALGVDVEDRSDIPVAALDVIARPDERAWIATSAIADPASRARLLLGAKECFYKCQPTAARATMAHADVHVIFDEARGTFTAAGVAAERSPLQGRFLVAPAHLLTGIAVLAPGDSYSHATLT